MEEIEILRQKFGDNNYGDIKTPSLVIFEEKVLSEYSRFASAFNWDRIFYAMKVNPCPELIKLFFQQGISFDVASEFEICDLLKLGIPGSSMILANPIKTIRATEMLFEESIFACAVDSIGEVIKLIEVKNRLNSKWIPKVLLRLKADSRMVEIDLNDKFGCSHSDGLEICKTASEAGLPISGLSFHVGSQSYLVENYQNAISSCLRFIESLPQELRVRINTVDIGGGYPSVKMLNRKGIAVDKFYNDLSSSCSMLKHGKFKVWSEPGRALATNGVGIISEVIGVTKKDGKNWLFLNEGKYGAYSGKYQDFQDFTFAGLGRNQPLSEQMEQWIVSGPTCDSTDVVAPTVKLPKDISRGDLVFSPDLGAYSFAFGCPFNGFQTKNVLVIR